MLKILWSIFGIIFVACLIVIAIYVLIILVLGAIKELKKICK